MTAVLSESSGYEVLDAAALAAAGRIGHVPKAPEVLAWNRRKVKVPFSFKLRS